MESRHEIQPLVHALLNGTAGLLLLVGWLAIKGRGPFAARGPDRALHTRLMLAAVGVSAVFLASYLDYHYAVGHTEFWGSGWVAGLYFTILIPHVLLAVVLVPLVFRLLAHARAGRLEAHRRLARVTWPIWMFVSASGVAVYLMLYPLRPAAA